MSTKHGTILLVACAMLAGPSAFFSAAHAQGFRFFISPGPPIYAAPPPEPYFDEPDFYEEAEPYYEPAPRYYRSERRTQRYAPAPRRKKPAARVERRVPAPRKPRATALAVPPKPAKPVVQPKAPATSSVQPKAAPTSPACTKAQSSVAEFGFKQITPESCNGRTLSFRAIRDGKTFHIQVLAENGELTKVDRVK
jgi:hypothetical protein